MTASSYSILREAEYKAIKQLELSGNILDIGGSKKSGYQELIGGEHTFTTVNIDATYVCDLVFDIQNRFPLEDSSFDAAVSMNVLEHIFDFHNVFQEVHRVLKPGGLFVNTTPFMHHVHGSPDDYFRYTKSTISMLAQKYNFDLREIQPLGFGLFSLLWQSVGGWVPTSTLRVLGKNISVGLDKLLLNFKKYQELRNRIPLGYYFVLVKKD
jgi:SAM-dependent methyltransferase